MSSIPTVVKSPLGNGGNGFEASANVAASVKWLWAVAWNVATGRLPAIWSENQRLTSLEAGLAVHFHDCSNSLQAGGIKSLGVSVLALRSILIEVPTTLFSTHFKPPRSPSRAPRRVRSCSSLTDPVDFAVICRRARHSLEPRRVRSRRESETTRIFSRTTRGQPGSQASSERAHRLMSPPSEEQLIRFVAGVKRGQDACYQHKESREFGNQASCILGR